MKAESIGQGPSWPHSISNRPVNSTSHSNTRSAPRPEMDAGADVHHASASEAPGVVRLLEAGHFKGVADVRLRINFFDELSSRAEAASDALLPSQTEAFVGKVQADLEELVASLDLTAEQQQAIADAAGLFVSSVNDAAEQFAGDEITLEGLADAIRTAFSALFEQVTSTTAVPEPSAPAEPSTDEPSAEAVISDPAIEPEGEAEAEPPPSADALLAGWTDAFSSALDEFVATLAGSARLPDPSPDPGHGGAYAKFLAMYDALRGGTLNTSA